MLQHLIILLNNKSTSFCHYDNHNGNSGRWIDLEDLKKGVKFAMMENLMVHFVYPEDAPPKRYLEVIDSIDHNDIRPFIEGSKNDAEVIVFNEIPQNLDENKKYKSVVFRLTFQEFFDFPPYLAKEIFQCVDKLNIVIRDIDPIQAWDFERYENKLRELSELIEQAYLDGFSPQWNILTDRMMLHEMNNCGAGDSTITLAPNGKFYICPAFYYEDMGDSVGDVNKGLDIPNQYLYKLENAPICRHCDAYQCKRCIWLNRKMTLEVNTPSHEQCVAAHLERNASRQLQKNIRKYGEFLPEIDEIKEIDYLDPFNNKEKWQQENL